jgi:hypothetical protein
MVRRLHPDIEDWISDLELAGRIAAAVREAVVAWEAEGGEDGEDGDGYGGDR